MSAAKDAYDARQKLKRIARGDDPNERRDDELALDLFVDLAERLIRAFEGIEMNTRQKS